MSDATRQFPAFYFPITLYIGNRNPSYYLEEKIDCSNFIPQHITDKHSHDPHCPFSNLPKGIDSKNISIKTMKLPLMIPFNAPCII